MNLLPPDFENCRVSHNTAKAWLSILEASYIIHRIPAWHDNSRKQIVKAAKLHFLDTGLVCSLLQIRESGQVRLHPLRGAIFESCVVSELYKTLAHQGEQPILHHYRESRGLEIDVLVQRSDCLYTVEVISGATAAPTFSRDLNRWPREYRQPVYSFVWRMWWSMAAKYHSSVQRHDCSAGGM